MTGGTSVLRLRLFSNRQGVASLAGVLLWLHANAYRREFLSLTALSFIEPEDETALVIRVSTVESGEGFGQLRHLDDASELEWELLEDGLQKFALRLHHLASVPEHEYDLLELAEPSGARLEMRLSDARDFI